jgi:hypothetical protein
MTRKQIFFVVRHKLSGQICEGTITIDVDDAVPRCEFEMSVMSEDWEMVHVRQPPERHVPEESLQEDQPT